MYPIPPSFTYLLQRKSSLSEEEKELNLKFLCLFSLPWLREAGKKERKTYLFCSPPSSEEGRRRSSYWVSLFRKWWFFVPLLHLLLKKRAFLTWMTKTQVREKAKKKKEWHQNVYLLTSRYTKLAWNQNFFKLDAFMKSLHDSLLVSLDDDVLLFSPLSVEQKIRGTKKIDRKRCRLTFFRL